MKHVSFDLDLFSSFFSTVQHLRTLSLLGDAGWAELGWGGGVNIISSYEETDRTFI